MTLVSLVFLLLLPVIVISFRGFLERGRRRRIEDGKNKSFEQTRKQNFPERFENEKQRKKNESFRESSVWCQHSTRRLYLTKKHFGISRVEKSFGQAGVKKLSSFTQRKCNPSLSVLRYRSPITNAIFDGWIKRVNHHDILFWVVDVSNSEHNHHQEVGFSFDKQADGRTHDNCLLPSWLGKWLLGREGWGQLAPHSTQHDIVLGATTNASGSCERRHTTVFWCPAAAPHQGCWCGRVCCCCCCATWRWDGGRKTAISENSSNHLDCRIFFLTPCISSWPLDLFVDFYISSAIILIA